MLGMHNESGACLLQAGVPDMSVVVNAKLEYALECSGFNVRSFIGAAAPDLAVSESDPVLQDLLQVGSGPLLQSCTGGGWSRRPQPSRRCARHEQQMLCPAVGSQAPS